MTLEASHVIHFPGEDAAHAFDIAEAAGQLIGVITAGQALSANDMEVLMFHLSGMASEPFPGSKSQWAMELATRAAPAFGRLYPPDDLGWVGTPLKDVPPPDALIAALSGVDLSDPQYIKFYYGEQWREDIREQRIKAGRPCLVINMLPAIVAASIAKVQYEVSTSGEIAEYDRQLILEKLAIAVTFINMDSQRLYNYMASSRAERAACPQVTFRSAE